ncbi:nucleoside-diphosphate sugar epimerase/dehydratase [uncultured Paracoccus sp.]|uniref:polysaccharide biosynthesis protein n=1 Tax=uncultured Paracoccus sp. TaxID=189685 RepID=UPI0026131D92|nr:nucleoside-diphosphate sugar epimerase/dehydratase [uncultured Paracoccus sp.]
MLIGFLLKAHQKIHVASSIEMPTPIMSLSRNAKRRIVFTADLVVLLASLMLAFVLRYGTPGWSGALSKSWPLLVVMAVSGAVLFLLVRLPQVKLRAFENRALLRLGGVAMALAICAMVTSYLLDLPTPRSVPLIFAALFFMMATGVRLLMIQLLQIKANKEGREQTRVAIYGAGAAGVQLAAALRQSHEARPFIFLDDNPNLQGLVIGGVPVYRPSLLPKLIARHKITRVLLAMPSAPRERQEELIASILAYGVEVQILPSFIDLMSNKGLNAQLTPVSPFQLLGRSKVDLDTPEIAKAYAGRVVMVTGAGGSIGSELCRQLVVCRPACIVLFERGEFALYSIDRTLRPLAEDAGIPVVSRLGSVTDPARVEAVVNQEGVEIILHAAAYKHVPLVEENELEGARNNVLGTKIVADAAQKAGVERFILVSTDKAVRPTNIMGATKRLAEMVVQDLQTRSPCTKFAMVRFGNVLGSSGSVLPLFQKQIETGGPVTVTHPEVTRFFMTIPEAARLVLLAGAYAKGGDVFVLDMGQPQKILDIAKKMIELSGRRVKDAATGQGDIAIEITGLRPGEKLYEELLLDDNSLTKTPHPKILCAQESVLGQHAVSSMLEEIETSIKKGDAARLRRLMGIYVEGYKIGLQQTVSLPSLPVSNGVAAS